MKKLCPLSVLIGLLPFGANADHTTVGLQGNIQGPNTTSSAQLMDVGTAGFFLLHQPAKESRGQVT